MNPMKNRTRHCRIGLATLVGILAFGPIGIGEEFMLDIVDGGFRTACGPICCYVALRSLGCECSLPAVARDCEWRDGKLTPFPKLHEALSRRRDVACRAVRLSPEQLGSAIRDGRQVAIIPIRKNSQEVNHAVCVVDADKSGVTTVDYPDLSETLTFEQLAESWDGETLLVSLSTRGWLGRYWAWLILPLGATIVMVRGLARPYRWQMPSTDETTGQPVGPDPDVTRLG